MTDDNERAPICWVVTDGRAGIEEQALGLAQAIGRRTPLTIIRKKVSIALPWRWAPWALWGDPFRRLGAGSDSLAAPYPDLWIGCGRLATPLTIAMKRVNPETFTIQLQDPRAPATLFDLVIPPVHDGLTGENVFPIIGSANRTKPVLAGARIPAGEGNPKVAILVGGPNRAFGFSGKDAARIADQLAALSKSGADISVTTSRRTPAAVSDRLHAARKDVTRVFWRAGTDDPALNPYPAMLCDADFILVTEDSVNMTVEAAATGRPVYVIPLSRRPFASAAKFDAFHHSLRARGISRRFEGALDHWAYEPLDETSRAADEALRRWKDCSR